MNRPATIAAFFLLAIAVCFGQDTSAPQTQAAAPSGEASDASAVRGLIPATLARSIDSKKLKEGDEVDAKTTQALHTSAGVMIPSGSKIIGRVTQSKAKSKGDPDSSLGIMFEKIDVGGGKQLPIKGMMQAVGPNPSEASGPDTGAAGGGTMAAHGGDPTTQASPLSGPGGPIGQKQEQGGQQGKMLNGHSMGVVGIKNLQLDNSILTSTNKEVKLDQGSQILIKAE